MRILRGRTAQMLFSEGCRNPVCGYIELADGMHLHSTIIEWCTMVHYGVSSLVLSNLATASRRVYR